MGVLERRQREKELLRQRIIDAASELFLAEGYENVSIRKIADRIEYAPSTIYLYFKDKEELLTTICRDTFGQLSERLKDVDQSLPPLEMLKKGLRLYIEFGIENPHPYLITFCLPHPAKSDSDSCEDVSLAGLAAFDVLRHALQANMDAGAIRKGDVELMSQTVWMFIHGVTNQLINSKLMCNFPFLPTEQLIESALDMVARSLQ